MKIVGICTFLVMLIFPIVIDVVSEWCELNDKLKDTEYRLWKLEKIIERLLEEMEQYKNDNK